MITFFSRPRRVYFFCFVWSFGGTFCQYGELEEDPEAGSGSGSNQVGSFYLSSTFVIRRLLMRVNNDEVRVKLKVDVDESIKAFQKALSAFM